MCVDLIRSSESIKSFPKYGVIGFWVVVVKDGKDNLLEAPIKSLNRSREECRNMFRRTSETSATKCRKNQSFVTSQRTSLEKCLNLHPHLHLITRRESIPSVMIFDSGTGNNINCFLFFEGCVSFSNPTGEDPDIL